MKTFFRFGTLLACTFLSGCGMSGSQPTGSAPAPMGQHPNDAIRVGDKITIGLTGVPDDGYFTERQIPESGTVSVPLLTQSFVAAGHTTSELSSEIATAYKEQKIYTNPVVTVLPEERYINVGGDVRGPSRVVYSPDSTVMSTINSCGGFTEYANRRAVLVIRGQQRLQVDCIKAVEDPGDDPPVYPGDQIFVPRTIF